LIFRHIAAIFFAAIRHFFFAISPHYAISPPFQLYAIAASPRWLMLSPDFDDFELFFDIFFSSSHSFSAFRCRFFVISSSFRLHIYFTFRLFISALSIFISPPPFSRHFEPAPDIFAFFAIFFRFRRRYSSGFVSFSLICFAICLPLASFALRHSADADIFFA
jgi:hypothetical protein